MGKTTELIEWLCQRTGNVSITLGIEGCRIFRGGDSRIVTPDQCDEAFDWLAAQFT